MRTQVDREVAADASLNTGEGEAAFDAWTLEELQDDLGSLRPAFSGSNDAGA